MSFFTASLTILSVAPYFKCHWEQLKQIFFQIFSVAKQDRQSRFSLFLRKPMTSSFVNMYSWQLSNSNWSHVYGFRRFLLNTSANQYIFIFLSKCPVTYSITPSMCCLFLEVIVSFQNFLCSQPFRWLGNAKPNALSFTGKSLKSYQL